MLKKLGKALVEAREKKALSLDNVAKQAKISGAYLHKLEHGVVKSPSPRVLARIAVALDTPYLNLMELAGYLNEMQLAEAQSRESSLLAHPLADQQLTTEEWKAVGVYIEKLIAKRNQNSGRYF